MQIVRKIVAVTLVFGFLSISGTAAGPADLLDRYNVVWDSPSERPRDSMPTGNGRIGLNVWVEQNGDLVFYVSKPDAYDDNGRLVKLGCVRVKLDPSPFAGSSKFRQTFKLRQSQIEVTGDEQVTLKVWVDANEQVIHIEYEGDDRRRMQVHFETWREVAYTVKHTSISDLYNSNLDGLANPDADNPYRTIVYPDVIVPGEEDRIVWYHHNVKSAWPLTMKHHGLGGFMDKLTDPLLSRTFGGAIKGEGFDVISDRAIQSDKGKNRHVAVHILSQHPTTITGWINTLDENVARLEKMPLDKAYKSHLAWWDEFWSRSWVHIDGQQGTKISQGYNLYRYMLACSCRDSIPVKHNGSIYTAPVSDDPDWRNWGPGYWWQNNRFIYWPMTVAGDFDLIQTYFDLYVDALPLAVYRTKVYFQHDGAYFPECLYFWGNTYNDDYGWDREGKHVSYSHDPYVRYLWQGALELLMMMQDFYDHTGDKDFVKKKLLPLAYEIITFYDEHYRRDEEGKIYIYPGQALEEWWDCSNPMPEVAGLHAVLPRLLDLPKNLTVKRRRRQWQRMMGELPDLPTRQVSVDAGYSSGAIQLLDMTDLTRPPTNGETIFSMAREVFDTTAYNAENSELYPVFPYRLYGLGKPDMDLALRTYHKRYCKLGNQGYDQDIIDAAYLGLTDEAKNYLIDRVNDRHMMGRFPTFWTDWGSDVPNQEHGGVLMVALHAMLMQCEGEKILLLPSWPKEWDVSFKLRAPYQTTVEGIYRDGKLQELTVMPKSREKDVVDMTAKRLGLFGIIQDTKSVIVLKIGA